MKQEANLSLKRLKVDGGATANNLLMQFQSDILNVAIDLPTTQETTALGAAYLAGLNCGYYQSLKEIENNWQVAKRYQSKMSETKREAYYQKWQQAIKATQIFK